MDLPLHPKGPGAEIQIVPLEGQDLAPAQAGGQFQQQKLVAAVLPGLDQQPLDLLRSQNLSLPLTGGSLQLSAGLRKISFSSTALSSAAWRVVWMPRMVWSERPSP